MPVPHLERVLKQTGTLATLGASMTDVLTREDLLQHLTYDAVTGIFVWAKPGRGRKVGARAGSICAGRRYRQISICAVGYFEHRLAWLAVHGKWPSATIDHIDRDGCNNAISNLREASASENQCNRGSARGYSKRPEGFVARIAFQGKETYLGTFASEEDARLAYLNARQRYHGVFCPLEEPTS